MRLSPEHHRSRTIILSLVPFPLLVFISSSVDLYLKNQAGLDLQLAVLSPFVKLFLLTWTVGFVLYLLRSKPFFRYLLWGYYLGAPFVLTYKFLLGLAERHPVLSYYGLGWLVDSSLSPALWLGAIAVAVMLVGRKADPRLTVRSLALFALPLIVIETFSLVQGVGPEHQSHTPAPRLRDRPPDGALGRPNVYHIVFDGLQTEIFELLRSPDLEKSLGGFIYFLENRAIYHGTAWSLASMFSSRRYGYDQPIEDFIDYGFNRLSFVSELERAGFETMAFVSSLELFQSGLFHQAVRHSDNFQQNVTTNTMAFWRLWLYGNIPPTTRRRLMTSRWLSEQTKRDFNRFTVGRALAESAPVTSYMSFLEFIGSEELRQGTSRYTFLHLLIPHDPYMLRSDCSHEGRQMTDPLPQTLCALRLLVELSDRLHELNRYEDALIVVHGDHGEPFRLNKDALVRTRARSLRTPLLIKPPGAKRTVGFRISTDETTLLDVAPTLLELLGLSSKPAFEGASLLGI